MDYEKEYKSLVAKIKNAHLYAQTDSTKNVLEDILPTLTESEDERIRKELIFFLKEEIPQCSIKEHADKLNEFVSYLEKQKEAQPGDEDRYMEGYMNGMNDALKEQQPAEWSEKDLQHKSWILECLADGERKMPEYAEDFRAAYNWLKSLRPQPEQEWTKEDNERYLSCLKRLGTGNPDQPETVNSKWFREHVCPQPHWKPSEEQMKYLAATIEESNENPILESLYNDLKKLM